MYFFQQKDFERYIYCSLEEVLLLFYVWPIWPIILLFYELLLMANDLAYSFYSPFNEEKCLQWLENKIKSFYV